MKLNVLNITDDGIEIDLSEQVAVKGAVEESVPVEAHLKAFRDNSDVTITGDFRTEMTLQCGRCLENCRAVIASDVSITFLPDREKGAVEEKHELSKDELNIGYYSDEEIDLTEVLKEQVEVNIPIKPLCGEDCKGICPLCGANLNERSCDCKDEYRDERWSELKKLFNERKE